MANLSEQSVWTEGIYQLEETDVVRGGAIEEGGISNLQAKQLADRTKWLKDNIGVIPGGLTEVDVTSNITVPAEDIFCKKVILAPVQSGKTVTLDIDSLPNGAYVDVTVRAFSSDLGKFVRVVWPENLAPLDWQINGSGVWLYAGETISLVKYSPRTYINNHNSQLNNVADIKYAYRAPALAIQARGQLLNRADYPRLYDRVSGGGGSAGGSGSMIPDSLWLSSINYSGCFSNGNGSTTFRVPDLRGVFIRGLDNGRGLDLSRAYNNPEGMKRTITNRIRILLH